MEYAVNSSTPLTLFLGSIFEIFEIRTEFKNVVIPVGLHSFMSTSNNQR